MMHGSVRHSIFEYPGSSSTQNRDPTRLPPITHTTMQTVTRRLSRPTCKFATTRPSWTSPLSTTALRFNHINSSQSSKDADSKFTHFGFQTVREEEKESLVKGVFNSVASNYDVMNDAMSMGVHRLWKDEYVSSLKPGAKGPLKCIDLAGGTGDIALRILDYARENYADRETSVDVVDINGEMLKEGYKRFKKTMYHNSKYLDFPCGTGK